MSKLQSLMQFAPGLCDAEDQNASVIVNVDTNDADENGLPVNTADVPEADMAEGAAAEAVATESSAVADDAADAGDGLEKVEEALNSIASERRGMTKTEAKLIDALAKQATARLYRGASASDRSEAILGAGIESIESGGFAAVVAACEENKKGIMETIKAFIQKVVDFFKSIFNTVKKYLSGSAKLKGRADEVKKRAGAAKKSTAEGKITLKDSSVLAVGDSATALKILGGVAKLTTKADDILGGNEAVKVIMGSITLLNKVSADGDAAKAEAEIKKVLEAEGAKLAKVIGAAGRTSEMLIGGLQVGTIVNASEYKVTLFAKHNELKEKSEFEVLNKNLAEEAATKAGALIDLVIKYQDGWKERDHARSAVETELKKIAAEAQTAYSKASGEDGFIKRFQTKRRIGQSVASNLMGIVSTEVRVLSHSLRVASKLLDWADKSVKELDKEDKKEEKK